MEQKSKILQSNYINHLQGLYKILSIISNLDLLGMPYQVALSV